METRQSTIKVIFTADVHGNYFPYDFRHERWGKGSLQRVHGFVAQQCKHNPVGTILIDGGDILQGEPTSYYFNYVSKRDHHRVSDFCNFIGYDVGVIGNHDIETGHEVFDDFIEHCNYPILGANAISLDTGQPYFEPYTIIRRAGVKIAVIGFVTPAIPQWIPKNVWGDMRFEDIRTSAEKWVRLVRETEKPDYVIGLFHSGLDDGIETPEYKENAVRETVESVDGFDLVLYGHDHACNTEEIISPSGRCITCINPGCYAHSVAEIDIKFEIDAESKEVISFQSESQLRYIGTLSNTHSRDFKYHFAKDFSKVRDYSQEVIGCITDRLDVTDAYFGSSAYIDLIQTLQLHVSGADISFSAPLFFNSSIEAGEMKVCNLFDLYRFEDHLFTIELFGYEIKNYLEMSYASWINQMNGPEDAMLKLGPMKNNPERVGFINFIFNFDSAAGICYEVDLTKPDGERVNIQSMESGEPFLPERKYKVAMTAYRANGGGELLTKGAGLTKEEIEQRIVEVTTMDIRHYLMEYFKKYKNICPTPRYHWQFVPKAYADAAMERERELLFGSSK